MADLPSATVTIDDEAGAFAGGTGYLVVAGCVGTAADITPRVFASAKSLIAQHGYAPAVDFAAIHIDETGLPVVFVGLPVVTAAVLGSQRSSGSGTSIVAITAGAAGYLEEVDAIITCVTGGTLGAGSGPVFDLSLDGGVTTRRIRLGTALTYTVPYVGIVITWGAGTVVAGDVYSFRTTAPMWDSAGLTSMRTALAAQLKLSRSWMLVGDLPSATFAGYVTTQANAYETSSARFVFARASVKDGGAPAQLAKSSGVKNVAKLLSTTTLTFAEVGATDDTITRNEGSWITDGFVVGDVVTVAGALASSGYNNVTGRIKALTATVLTFDTTDLINESLAAGLGSVVGSNGLIFAEVGMTGDTITRNAGSWVADGFAAGDKIKVAGTASNNITESAAIVTVTATVITLDTDDLTAEEIRSDVVTITKVQTKASYIAATDTAFASVDAQKRIDMSIGRARKASPITGWAFRRPASWAASIREYQHDVQIPCWRKSDGPLDGWDLKDAAQNIVEIDDRVDGGALAARFTCFRSFSNGPNGTFIGLSLTRATEGSLLSRTHNLAVANLACTVTHAETEHAIGQVLILNDNGTGTDASLSIIEQRVNSALQIALLQGRTEGPRASSAVWRASRTDVLNVPAATLTGVLDLRLNGTLEKISTVVRIQTGG